MSKPTTSLIDSKPPNDDNLVDLMESSDSPTSQGLSLPRTMDINEIIYEGDLDDEKAEGRYFCSEKKGRGSIFVTRGRLWCLKPFKYLNDEVMSYYIHLLGQREKKRAAQEGRAVNILFFGSQFFRMLSGDAMFQDKSGDVDKWLKKVQPSQEAGQSALIAYTIGKKETVR